MTDEPNPQAPHADPAGDPADEPAGEPPDGGRAVVAVEPFVCSFGPLPTAVVNDRLIVVRLRTADGREGLGCATFTQRPAAVVAAVDALRPIVLGRDSARVEDLWRTMHHHAYWRSGPVLNAAISGVDMALWDLVGKRAGMPVYDLLGGACRDALALYRTVVGATFDDIDRQCDDLIAQGVTHLRVLQGWYGGGPAGDEAPAAAGRKLKFRTQPGAYYDPAAYMRSTPKLLGHLRDRYGDAVELIHDVHERLTPSDALRFGRALEEFRLYFVEDLFAPEDAEWYARAKQHLVTPLAAGELFTNVREWQPLVADRSIDFLRVHLSQLGGLTPARKAATFAELQGVRTAWHAPNDMTPVGHAANLHLSMASPNFGVQEWPELPLVLAEVFPGCPQPEGGHVAPSDRPGWGVGFDERAAGRFPGAMVEVERWSLARLPDGTAARP